MPKKAFKIRNIMAQVEDNGEKDVAEGGGGGGSGDEKKEEGDRKEEYNGGEHSEEGGGNEESLILVCCTRQLQIRCTGVRLRFPPNLRSA